MNRLTRHPIGVGLVGVTPGKDFRSAGWAFAAHLPALQALEEYQVRAVSSRRLQSAEETCRAFSVRAAYSSTKELVTDPSVDLVVVTVRVPAHKEVVEAALESGKHVFCEWPLALNAAEAKGFATLAKAKGLHCGISLQARGSPTIRYVRDLVREGWIGEILSTSLIGTGMNWGPGMVARNDYTLFRENGATLLSIAVGHAVDAVQYCLGPICEVESLAGLRRPLIKLDDGSERFATAEDQWIIAARFEAGAVGSIHYRGGQVGGDNLRWEINGSEGDLVISSKFGNIQPFSLQLSGARTGRPIQTLAVPRQYWIVDGLEDPALNVAQTYRLFARDIADRGCEAANFEDGVRLHALLEKVGEADRSGARQSCL